MATKECDKDVRSRLASEAVRGEPHPPEGGGLPDARLDPRSRRGPRAWVPPARALRPPLALGPCSCVCLPLDLGGGRSAVPPVSSDRSDLGRAHYEAPERRDCPHVQLAEPPFRPDQGGHLASVAAGTVGNPTDMLHHVHSSAGTLGNPFGVGP